MPFAHAYFVQYTTKIQNKTHHLTTKFTLLSRRTNSVLWAQNMISFYWAEQNEFQHDPVICRRNAHGCFATRNASGIRSLSLWQHRWTNPGKRATRDDFFGHLIPATILGRYPCGGSFPVRLFGIPLWGLRIHESKSSADVDWFLWCCLSPLKNWKQYLKKS